MKQWKRIVTLLLFLSLCFSLSMFAAEGKAAEKQVIAMTRHEPGKGPAFHDLEEDKLTLEEAIKAYTIDAAYHLRWDNIIGSIEVGKRADLIVLDRNLFDSTTGEIAEANVLLTMVNGMVAHEDSVDWEVMAPAIEFNVCQ